MTTDVTLARRVESVVEPMSDAPPYTPLWWVERLHRRMVIRNRTLARLRAYYRGEQDTWRLASEAHRSAFGSLFAGLKSNLAKPVVDAVEQRLAVEGFAVPGDKEAEQRAWGLWRANGLVAASSLAHTEALSTGECPVIVWREPRATETRISVEDPLTVIVERSILDRRVVLAGLKAWWDPDDRATWAVLYLPGQVHWWRHKSAWEPRGGGATPLAVVPIVTLVNMPRLMEPVNRYSPGEAEHEAVIPLLDAYNKTLLDMLTTSEFSAFPQRYAIGVSFKSDDETGSDPSSPEEGSETTPASDGLRWGVNRLATFEAPDTSVGQFEVSSLEPYISALAALRSDISSVTHTPHRKLLPPPTSVPPSGESVRLGDEGLTKKVEDRQVWYGDAWEDAIRLAFWWEGDLVRAARFDIETLWKDPEVRTEAEHTDAVLKKSALGVPRQALWRELGATPEQIEEWDRLAESSPSLTTQEDR